MGEEFSTIKPDILRRWTRYIGKIGIPEEAYITPAKIISGSRQSDYTFGAILNAYRFQRFNKNESEKPSCVLCDSVSEVKTVWEKNLFPEYALPGFSAIPNIFPATIGASLAIANRIGERERPVYGTSEIDVRRLAHEISDLLAFSDVTGLQIFHNSPGLGSSIPQHEHWHLTDFGSVYGSLGEVYGFDAAEKVGVSEGVSKMPNFPFAHLIFDREDPERLTRFLQKIGRELGQKFENGSVPHTISQGRDGLLVAIAKNYKEKGIGSGDLAGHIIFKSKEEFEKADFRTCIKLLKERIPYQNELNLEKFL